MLISGAGLLLLSMTNRITRPLDRIRLLGKDLKSASPQDQAFYLAQIQTLYKRTFILQKAITGIVLTIISASVIILLIFLIAVFSVNLYLLIDFVFIIGLMALILSLIYFLWDIGTSLKSVQIEMNRLKSHYPELST